MDRRHFIRTLGLALLVAPLAAEAQAGGVYRIGVLLFNTPAVPQTQLEAFQQGLRELGYVEGKNITLEVRNSEGRTERFPDFAAELVRCAYGSSVAPACGAGG